MRTRPTEPWSREPQRRRRGIGPVAGALIQNHHRYSAACRDGAATSRLEDGIAPLLHTRTSRTALQPHTPRTALQPHTPRMALQPHTPRTALQPHTPRTALCSLTHPGQHCSPTHPGRCYSQGRRPAPAAPHPSPNLRCHSARSERGFNDSAPQINQIYIEVWVPRASLPLNQLPGQLRPRDPPLRTPRVGLRGEAVFTWGGPTPPSSAQPHPTPPKPTPPHPTPPHPTPGSVTCSGGGARL